MFCQYNAKLSTQFWETLILKYNVLSINDTKMFTLISETLAHEIFIQRFSRNIFAHFNNSLAPPDVDVQYWVKKQIFNEE